MHSWALGGLVIALACTGAQGADENMLKNGDFGGTWRPLVSTWDTGTAEGTVPEQWEDISTWSGASTRYSRVVGPNAGAVGLRLELTQAENRRSVLQLRSAFDVTLQAGGVYEVRLAARSRTGTPIELAVRQHQPPRIVFWQARARTNPQWRDITYVFEAEQSGKARFFAALRKLGEVQVAQLSLRELSEDERPVAGPPISLSGVRCVPVRGELLTHSDIIAMYQEADVAVLRKHLVDVVAWGGQLQASEDKVRGRKRLIEKAHDAGVRMHAVDCAMVQEGGKFVVSGGDRASDTLPLFWQLRKDNPGTIAKLQMTAVDLRAESVLNVEGDWIGVPWLRKRWRIPMASVHSPRARQWFREHMDAIAQTGLTALHFDEPGMGAYGVQHPTPGDFSGHTVKAFREWLAQRPAAVWQDVGVETLEGFDYRQFVLAHGGEPTRAPLWREFVRFQLFTTADLVRELRDRVRAKAGRYIPLSMNANAGSWIKLPFLHLQDFMTTEVAHEAGGLRPPPAPLLVYKLGDAFGQPVAATAHGHDWYLMKTDQHPVLVSAWMSMAYALGHHLMIPCKAWVMDPVKGSDTYRPNSDHYACLARFIKSVGHLLDGYCPVSTVAVVVGCDAIEQDRAGLEGLSRRLADANIPFSVAVEGNDLLERVVAAEDVAGCSAVMVAGGDFLTPEAAARLYALAGQEATMEYLGGPLPKRLPRPIALSGAQGVWVLPRMAPEDTTAPAVLHLLNRDYDPAARKMKPKGPFSLRVDPVLFGGREFKRASLHQPRLFAEMPQTDTECHVTAELAVEYTGGELQIQVPSLDLWGVIELQ